MKVLQDNFKVNLTENTFITLGSFDGLHLGHMKLINTVLECAKKEHITSMVYTFKEHPLTVINENLAPKLIMDNSSKINMLEKKGLGIVNLVPISKEYMNLKAEEFIKLMIEHYNVKGVVVGFNFKFGYKNEGNVKLLEKLSQKYNFKLHIVNPVTIDEKIVCSSRIRQLLKNGEIQYANEMLGRKFFLEGNVIKGKQLGSRELFPTANIDISSKMIVPKKGVYFTAVEYNGEIFKSLTNVGYCPTVDGNKFSIETNILGFNKNIYGQNIKVNFIKRIRDEKKFGSILDLKQQLQKDKMLVEGENLPCDI